MLHFLRVGQAFKGSLTDCGTAFKKGVAKVPGGGPLTDWGPEGWNWFSQADTCTCTHSHIHPSFPSDPPLMTFNQRLFGPRWWAQKKRFKEVLDQNRNIEICSGVLVPEKHLSDPNWQHTNIYCRKWFFTGLCAGRSFKFQSLRRSRSN